MRTYTHARTALPLPSSTNVLFEWPQITEQAHAFKGYSKTYNIYILNSFNLEQQLKDTESAIKDKLKKLLTELSRFEFVTTLVLVLKKIESEDKTKHDTFY